MGTLFEQRPRYETLNGMVEGFPGYARLLGYDLAKMTAADWHVVCDIVRTTLALQSADVLDEQLGGFGEILQELVEAVKDLRRDDE